MWQFLLASKCLPVIEVMLGWSSYLPIMIHFMTAIPIMPISIKNVETEQLARKVAALTGETLNDVIRIALTEKYDRLLEERSGRSLIDDLKEITRRCASLPRISDMTDDEILGYDEFGIPTR